MPRAAVSITLSPEQGAELEARVGSASTPPQAAVRAKIVLLAAQGRTNSEIARELPTSAQAVGLWRARFAREGLAGLDDRARSGRPQTLSTKSIERALALMRAEPAAGASLWSVRRVAAETAISPASVQRLWQQERDRVEQAQLPEEQRQPALAAKQVEAVGLYLNPPDAALVLATSDETQDAGQAGDRSLAAALAAPAGQLVRRRQPRPAHDELLAFLRRALREVPIGELHLLLAPSPTNTTPELARFLARPKNRRLHTHQPGGAWTDAVASWLRILSQHENGAHAPDAGELLGAIDRRLRTSGHEHSQPFTWLKSTA